MNRRILILAFLMTIVIPCVVYSRLSRWQEPQTAQEVTVSLERAQHFLSVLTEGEQTRMELEDYVQCVLLGEIPADFEMEALKAQAVATRTYTLRNIGHNQKHDMGVLCADSNCCQAFCTPTEYIEKGGSPEYIARIQDAVKITAGEVLLYNGQLIEATYFSASGGRTEAAVAVWGKDIPYLQSVESAGEQAQQYEKQCVQFTPQEFLEKLNLPIHFIGQITCTNIKYTPGNGVAYITICGQSYTGKQLRALLGLPSTVFEIDVKKDSVRITTDGNGHRVGMSQYGADAMAVQGKTYAEILEHYYPGTNLYVMNCEEYKGAFDKAGNL